jgi:hypothetical protein
MRGVRGSWRLHKELVREHLAQFAEVGEELADFGVGRIRHVTDPWALAGSTDCGKIRSKAL